MDESANSEQEMGRFPLERFKFSFMVFFPYWLYFQIAYGE